MTAPTASVHRVAVVRIEYSTGRFARGVLLGGIRACFDARARIHPSPGDELAEAPRRAPRSPRTRRSWRTPARAARPPAAAPPRGPLHRPAPASRTHAAPLCPGGRTPAGARPRRSGRRPRSGAATGSRSASKLPPLTLPPRITCTPPSKDSMPLTARPGWWPWSRSRTRTPPPWPPPPAGWAPRRSPRAPRDDGRGTPIASAASAAARAFWRL